MIPFEITHQAFWTIAVASVCSVSCALLGCFLLLKRMSMLGDAIGHGVLPGIVIAVLLTGQVTSVYILVGAMIFGLLTAVLSETLASSTSVSEDASLGVVFTSLFALGVIVASKHLHFVDFDLNCVFLGLLEAVSLHTDSYFGWNIPQAFPIMLLSLILTLAFLGFFWKELKIVAFDPALAQSMGFSPKLVNYLLIALVAGSTVSAFEAVGLILVLAVLIVPAATAHLLTDRLAPMLGWSAFFAFSASSLGFACHNVGGYSLDISGMIAVMLGAQFAIVILVAPSHGLIAKWWRNLQLSLRIAEEDILATLYRAEEAGVPTYSLALKEHGLSPWVVSYAYRKVIRLGLLTTNAVGLPVLTDLGRQRAQYVVRSHRLWETYAGAVLEIPPDHVHSAAALVEHYIGPQLQDELATALNSPPTDPHGKSIPPKQSAPLRVAAKQSRTVSIQQRKPKTIQEQSMQGNPQVIDALNRGLTIELTAINQYFCQAKMCMNWGYKLLGKKHYEESMGEMKHAEKLIDRILFLEGTPEIARYDVIRVGTNVKEQFENDLKLEMSGVKAYNAAIELCTKVQDNGSRELLAPILVESEEHVDWLETQLALIDAVGLQNYLTEQMGGHDA